MNLSDLLSEGRVRKVEPDPKQAEECLSAARRDIAVAKSNLATDFDWAFSIAYNAMLQSSRALMFSDGYVAVGENQHKVAVDYADVKLGTKMGGKIVLFDEMRKKRHRVIYEKVGIVSEYEAKHAILAAEDLLLAVEKKIKGKN
ncbi:HEPN domain-containing protein [Candidatus Parvarchaeota archaeon]|nr:HEPN domain-containing protein [Candidatus Parvarchaeota archaeon]